MRIVRANYDEEFLNWFKNVYTDFLKDNKGYKDVLCYIEGHLNGTKKFWARYAKKADMKVIKRGEDYYIKS